MVLRARGKIELREDVRDVLLDRALGDDQARRDPRVRATLGHQREDFALSWRQLLEAAVAGDLAEQLRDGLGIERSAALGDPLDGGGEVGGSATRSLGR